MKISILAATAVLMAGACSAQAANIEFWYGNTGPVETAIKAQCDTFNAAQTQHHITCVVQGSYESRMQKAIAAYRAKNHRVPIAQSGPRDHVALTLRRPGPVSNAMRGGSMPTGIFDSNTHVAVAQAGRRASDMTTLGSPGLPMQPCMGWWCLA